MLSVMTLSLTKAFWKRLMTLRRTSFSLLTNVFETILYSTLHGLKGRLSLNFDEPSDFEIKIIVV